MSTLKYDSNFVDSISPDHLWYFDQSLQELSGNSISTNSEISSSVSRGVELSWKVPINYLTCEQVRLLISQKRGIKWLSVPAVSFVYRHPNAEISFYPGDFTMAVLSSIDEIFENCRLSIDVLRQVDLSWMDERYDFDDKLKERSKLLRRKLCR